MKKNNKVNLNFKVDQEIKNLLKNLVVLKSVIDQEPSSQHAILKEALITLMKKYNSDLNKNE